LLPPEEAFRASARQVAPGVVEIAYTIAPGYYLYRERFSFSTKERSRARRRAWRCRSHG
jgi:thiol:disulfide interchange protein DsbD